MAGPSTPVRDELDALLQDMYENLSEAGTPVTPGRGLILGHQTGTGNRQYICTGTIPGQFLPEYRCTQVDDSAPLTPTTRSSTIHTKVTGAERWKTSPSKQLKRNELDKMRDKKEPKRAARGIPEKGKKKRRLQLPPVLLEGESDDESWIQTDQLAIEWYVQLLTTSLRDPDYAPEALQHLKAAWDKFGVGDTCHLDKCLTPSKSFSTVPRYARHLVEDHLRSRPIFGCSAASTSKICVPLPDGRRFHHTRRGQLVRHLASVHQLGAEKALEYVHTIWRYPTEESKPSGVVYPRTIYYHWEINADAPPLRLKETLPVSPKDPGPPPDAVGSADATLHQAAAPEEELPTPPEPTRVPPPEGLTPAQPSGISTPVPSTSATGQSVLTTPVNLSPATSVVAAFEASWIRVGNEAREELRASLSKLKELQEEQLATLREQHDAELAAKNSELASSRAELADRDEQLNTMTQEMGRLKEQLKTCSAQSDSEKEETVFARAEARALKERYDVANRKFVRITGFSLESWDGSREKLTELLDNQK